MTDGWDERELTDEQIDEMLADLDSHAREVDNYDLGLPLSTEHLPKLREIVRESLAARASAAPLNADDFQNLYNAALCDIWKIKNICENSNPTYKVRIQQIEAVLAHWHSTIVRDASQAEQEYYGRCDEESDLHKEMPEACKNWVPDLNKPVTDEPSAGQTEGNVNGDRETSQGILPRV